MEKVKSSVTPLSTHQTHDVCSLFILMTFLPNLIWNLRFIPCSSILSHRLHQVGQHAAMHEWIKYPGITVYHTMYMVKLTKISAERFWAHPLNKILFTGSVLFKVMLHALHNFTTVTCGKYNMTYPCAWGNQFHHQFHIHTGCFWRNVLQSIFLEQKQTLRPSEQDADLTWKAKQ